MSPFPTTLVRDHTGRAYLTVYVGDGDLPPCVPEDHPHFDALREAADGPEATPQDIRELSDLSAAVARRFERLSERVSVAHGHVYLDGDRMDTSLAEHIVRCLDEGVDDFRPWVAFLENISANPSDNSREQLFDWLRAHAFTITSSGEIVGYKGVAENWDGSYSPTYGSGPAIVDGVEQQPIQQRLGSTVELPRGDVVDDPSNACSYGLHVGTFAYAKDYARNGCVLKVAVNPRDVVSVPRDGGGEKVRACRYRVLEVVEAETTTAIDSASKEACQWCVAEAGYFDCDGDPACEECASEHSEYDPYTRISQG